MKGEFFLFDSNIKNQHSALINLLSQHLEGLPLLMARLLYGTGIRLN
jgi:hypothetical protein